MRRQDTETGGKAFCGVTRYCLVTSRIRAHCALRHSFCWRTGSSRNRNDEGSDKQIKMAK